MNVLTVLAAATDGSAGATGGMGIGFIVLYILFFVAIVYFLFIKPSNKQRQQQEEMAKSIKVGCSIMTTSGFYGTVIGIVDDDTVIVEFGNNKNCRIPMHKKAIAEVEDPNAAVASSDSDSDGNSDGNTDKNSDKSESKTKLGKKK